MRKRKEAKIDSLVLKVSTIGREIIVVHYNTSGLCIIRCLVDHKAAPSLVYIVLRSYDLQLGRLGVYYHILYKDGFISVQKM